MTRAASPQLPLTVTASLQPGNNPLLLCSRRQVVILKED